MHQLQMELATLYDEYMNFKYIQQNAAYPWQVELYGHYPKNLTIVISHPEIGAGRATFTNLKIKNGKDFSYFVGKMIRTFSIWKKTILFRAIDALELCKAYESEVKRISTSA